MILFALEIPDDPTRLPGWLERQLTGMHLAELVAELSAVHAGPVTEATSLQELLGDRLESVIEEGLGVLPLQTIQQLLREPRLLLELQEMIFVSGDAYWDRVASTSGEVRDVLARGKRKLEDHIAPGSRTTLPFPSVRWYRRPVMVSIATAAAVLLAVFAYQHSTPQSITSTDKPAGDLAWSRKDALPQDVAAKVYLERVADAAEDWFKETPQTAPEVAVRINKFRAACSQLILAPHTPLAPADKHWLVERCRMWADNIEKHLAALEAGRPPEDVRKNMDDTVNRLIKAIRERAENVA